jgi:ElaB/YqjD/DUF883 family membrane-anchored ribosome-binding protein
MTDHATEPGRHEAAPGVGGPGRSRSADEIEREINAERGRIRRTLGELEDRMSVGAMIDRIGDIVSTDGRAAMQSVGGAVRANPVPMALIGLGIAWMGISARRHDDDPYRRSMTERARDRAAGLEYRARGASASAREHAGSLADRARFAAQDAEARLGRGTRHLRHRADEASAGARGFFDENPLAAGALAFAAGAAVGAMMPNSRYENRMLGDHAEEWRDDARRMVEDGADRARRAAGAAAETVSQDVSSAVTRLREEGGDAAQKARDEAAGTAGRAAGAAETEARQPSSHGR